MDTDIKTQIEQMRAEIGRLNVELAASADEISRLRTELSRADPESADIDRMLRTQVSAMIAETDRIMGRSQWIPFLIGSGFAIAAIGAGIWLSGL